jgi:hypothetical protein
MPKKQTRRKGSKTSASPKVSSRGLRVIVDPNAKPSPYAVKALSLFSSGVQRAYRDLARKGVKTVVIENGVRVSGVPRVSGGRFVVREGVRKKA